MYFATGVEPTNEIARTAGWASRASTGTLAAWTTFRTPGGRPASSKSCARSTGADGSFSLGLRITVLPHAMAIGTNHIGTMAGKLNGEMTPTTPSGWRSEKASTFVETPSL